ncbi:hypothetical protein LguiB_034562 [Lonicera macranthoides]
MSSSSSFGGLTIGLVFALIAGAGILLPVDGVASDSESYLWTDEMLSWQRTAYHFQPAKNWMNGPLFHKGWYHLFYQYNPYAAIWGNITWGHTVSTDLIHWHHLPIAMTYDQWYDINGVWTGSATTLPNGQIFMIYTGITNNSVEVQNLAYPANLSDPLLIDWVKYSNNPVIVPPPGIGLRDFRDPTTAWLASNGKWQVTIGSKINGNGFSLVYETEDFKSYELLNAPLHSVPGTGMWECVDFYPISKVGENGLDTSANGPQVKHVFKASISQELNDYYAIGFYDAQSGKWSPDDPTVDVGIGLRYDYGTYYASKTFYDHNKSRRVLLSWIEELDSEDDRVKKGWASLQGIPRTILFDMKTGSNILQWPVQEVESLRLESREFDAVQVSPGSVLPLDLGSADQLDINAEFEVDKEAMERLNGTEAAYNCSTSGGAAARGALGPFGLLVLADNNLSEQTPVYFYITKGVDGNLKTFFCTDLLRSSEATDVVKEIYGNTVPVLKGEKLSVRILVKPALPPRRHQLPNPGSPEMKGTAKLRLGLMKALEDLGADDDDAVLVDHSIVESFAQGGRTTITSRVYPTKAISGQAKLFLFNNATHSKVTASLKIWQMDSAYIGPLTTHTPHTFM